MRLLLPAWLTIAVVFVAGCIGSEGAAPAGAASASGGSASFDESTGAIDGLVHDDAIQPIAGAQVQVKETGANATTDDLGRFAFGSLAPGTYTLFSVALGYEASGSVVEVQAGGAVKARITLRPISSATPFPSTKEFTGLIECAVGVEDVTTGNCLPIQFLIQQYDLPNPTNTRIIGLYQIDNPSNVESGVFEMTWNPSAATSGGQLLLLVEQEGSGAIEAEQYGEAQGASPLKVITDAEPFKALKPADKKDKVQTRTFPAATTPPTYVLNQKFTVYATACYFVECEEKFTAVKDS